MAIKQKLAAIFGQRFNRWLSKRMPPSSVQQLNSRNIFIMPSKFGITFLLLVLLLFLLATNYQNNIIMLLSYLMASLFISAMMQSFFNFSGLVFQSRGECQGYAGQVLNILVTVTAPSKRFALNFSFDGQKIARLEHTGKQELVVKVPFYSDQRGVFTPGRIKVMSEYSLGLFTTWTRLDFATICTVYPEPKALKNGMRALSAAQSSSTQQRGGASIKGVEDFFELKSYLPGEPLSRVAWKQFARGQGKFSKQYQENQGELVWLNLADMPAIDLETKLQLLCFLISHYAGRQQKFGLNLLHHKIEPNAGKQHIDLCLRALAHYPKISGSING
jgi:uncharacterized protein (DUF58 family)